MRPHLLLALIVLTVPSLASATGTITGTVTALAEGTALAGVTISVQSTTGSLAWAVTDASGAFTVADLAAGTYHARAAAGGDYLVQDYGGVTCSSSR